MSTKIPEGVLFGLGNPLLDITVKTDLKFLEKYDLKANNAILAGPEHMPLFEEMMRDFKPEYGAGGATQNSIRIAQWLLQEPQATTYAGGVGKDERAQILKEKAEEAGIKVLYCVSALAPTGVCGALITGTERSLVAHLGAADFFTHEWMQQPEQWQYVEKAQVFYIGGFVFPVCNEGIFTIAKHACSNNKTLAMNLSAPFLCKYYADPRHNIMQYVDILFGNEAEAAEFCKLQGIETNDIREMALQTSLLPKANNARSRMVVFTQGRDPTIIAKDGEVYTFPITSVPKESIRDTNGCGDSFVGGFLAQYVQGKEIEECVRCGMYAARYIIQQWGCSIHDKPDFE